jgi:putative endonuclease
MFNKVYVGFTANLPLRLKSHNELAAKDRTIKFRSWKPVHTEIFEMKSDAVRREEELKTAKAGNGFGN